MQSWKVKAIGIMFPGFYTILQGDSIQNSMALEQNRHRIQWNRIESLEISSHIYGGQLI